MTTATTCNVSVYIYVCVCVEREREGSMVRCVHRLYLLFDNVISLWYHDHDVSKVSEAEEGKKKLRNYTLGYEQIQQAVHVLS